MKRRLIPFLTAAAMLMGSVGSFPAAGAEEGGRIEDMPPVYAPAEEPEGVGEDGGESFPAPEFEEWEPAENTDYPGGLTPNPFWQAHIGPVEPMEQLFYSVGELPTSYDLRVLGRSTTVKSQYQWGTCWAFGSLAALESNILTRSGVSGSAAKSTPDYSEHQLAWFAYRPQTAAGLAGSEAGQGQAGEGRTGGSSPLNKGGNPSLTTSVLAAWQGAANENSIPYQNTAGGTSNTGDWSLPESRRNESVVHLTNADFLPSPICYSSYGSDSLPTSSATFHYDKEAEKTIKRTIMEEGAVSISYYADQSKPAGSKDGTYFNYAHNCQYVNVLNASTMPNHEVCVVGWDDNYPRTNFNSSIQPERNGAWIVKNSWGAGYYDKGYFYLSYYDRTIRDVTSFRGETEFSYSHNYQYDYLQLGSYLSGYISQAKTGVANVFTANGRETLKAVGLVTDKAESEVTLEIYRLRAGAAGPYVGTLASSCSEIFPYAGYHTLELDSPVYLSPGDRFSVVAVVRRPNGYYSLPLEIGCTAKGYVAVINRGETYLVAPTGRKYEDVSTKPEGTLSSGLKYKLGNAMLKAFTVDTDLSLPRVTTQPVDQEGRVGSTVSFSVAAEGEGLSYQWQSREDADSAWTDIPGAAGETYTPSALTFAMEGWRYRCKISNGGGTIFSDEAAIASVLPATVTEISTLAELESFRDLVNTGTSYAGVTIRLTADIDLSEKYSAGMSDWTPIGSSAARAFPATAIFDGGGHTVSGVYVSNSLFCGLFGYSKGTIKDLSVSGTITNKAPNSYRDEIAYVGGVCGYNDGGQITGCRNAAAVTCANGISDGICAGGICGYNKGGSITGCSNTGAVAGKNGSCDGDMGGICGYNDGGSITSCSNAGSVTCTSGWGGINSADDGLGKRLGGVCGYSAGGSLRDCRNTGPIADQSTFGYYVGGVCGGGAGFAVRDCYNTGSLSTKSSNAYTGGVCGWVRYSTSATEIENCYNTGSITGGDHVGGICGHNENLKTTWSFSDGSETSTTEFGTTRIKTCYNTGSLEKGSIRAGICGYDSAGVTIQNCFSTWQATSWGYGICGGNATYYENSGDGQEERSLIRTIENCYYRSESSWIKGLQWAGADIAGQVEAKTAGQFASGEVAYLLQSAKGGTSAAQVWGQGVKGIGLDAAPLLTGAPEKAVYKVSFCIRKNSSDTVHAVKYANPAGVSGLPSAPVSGTTKLTRWSLTPDVDGEEFTVNTPISADTRVYAIGETMYGEGQGEKAVTLTYGADDTPARVDLSQYVTMGDSSAAQGKFKFTITDGGVDSVRITDMEILEIAADIPANEAGYPITIRAFKLSSDPILMSAGTSLGTESFLFTVTVVVRKAEGTGSVSLEGWVYGEDPKTPAAVSATNGVEHVTYLYKAKDAGEESYSETVPTAAGEYTVLATFAGTNNYNEVQATANFTIAQALSALQEAPQPRTLAYTGQAQELVTAGSAVGGEVQYSLDGESYSASIPTATEAGSYTVYYRVVGDSDHLDAPGGTVTARIDEAVYKVTLECGGGIVNGEAPKQYTKGTRTPLPTDVTRLGYHFAGWYDNASLTGTAVTEIPADAVGDKTFYAKWVEQSGGGSGGGGGGSHDDRDDESDRVTQKPAVVTAPEPTPTPQPETVPFLDVTGEDWFYDAVQEMSAAGLMQGVTESEFAPDIKLTRGMAMTILYRMEDEPETDFASAFEDVASNMYFAKPIAWGNQHMLVKGYTDTCFSPNGELTREQMAVIIYRFAEYKGLDLRAGGSLSYTDRENVSEYAREAVRWVTGAGIMQGDNANLFCPRDPITRAESAAVFQRLLKLLEPPSSPQ